MSSKTENLYNLMGKRMSKILILKVLFNLKLRNYYNNINRIFHIYLNNKIYFSYKLLKMLLVWVSLNMVYNIYYKNEYFNYIIVFYTIMLLVVNIGLTDSVGKSLFKPHNIELYQISNISSKYISLLFLITEYVWKKFKEADWMIPLFLIALKIGKIKIFIYTICVESILIFIIQFKIYVCKNIRQEKVKYDFIIDFARYVVLGGVIIKITSVLANKGLMMSKMLRQYLYSVSALNDDTIKNLSVRLLEYFKGIINVLKDCLDINILEVVNGKTLIIITVINIVACYYIINCFSINYSKMISELTKENGKAKEKYLYLIHYLSSKYKNYFLIEKDLKIIKNKISILNKDIFDSVFIPYDFFIIIIFAYCLKQQVQNNYLIVVSVIFCMVSILFNQVNTIAITFSSVFRFESDIRNADLYRISKFTINDVLDAKIYLCRVMTFIPFVITIFVSGVLLVGVGETLVENLLFEVIMFIIAVAIFFLAPEMKLYIYNYLMENKQFDEEKVEEEKIDEITHRFCDIPKNFFILPMMYWLLINSAFCLTKGKQWQIVFVSYLLWFVAMYFILNMFILKKLKNQR